MTSATPGQITRPVADRRGKIKPKCSNQRVVLILNLFLLAVQVIVPTLYYHASDASASLTPISTGTGVGGGVPPPPPLHQASETQNRASKNASSPDGSFNGFDVWYRNPSSSQLSPTPPLHSTVHCMGETFGDRSWLHRSCEFRNLCFDLDDSEFVLFRSPADRRMEDAFGRHRYRDFVALSSSARNVSVSLGGINPQWGWKPNQSEALEWWPRVEEAELTGGYYELPADAVMVPFHSMAAVNVGHLLWDDFFPLFTLLHSFRLAKDGGDLVLIRYVLKDRPRALWATCDLRDNTQELCRIFFKKFLPMMGINAEKQYTIYDSVLDVPHSRKSNYVCSPKGAAGIGMLTDHGLKLHGWEEGDYETTHNIGRGPVMFEFRNFMMRNLGMDPSLPVPSEPPYKIVFSIHSSKDPDRNTAFHEQREALESLFANDTSVSIEAHKFKDLSLVQEVTAASEASVFVTACGGGAVSSMFLPKGGSVIVFYPDKPTSRQKGKHKHPARLDWDFLNNMGYVRVHWLPTRLMRMTPQVDAFVELVRNELETISHH